MARTMKGKVVVIGVVLQIVIMTNVVWPGGAKVAPIVQGLQKWYDNLADFEADFYQKSFSQTLKATSEARGKIYFKKPNLMKWDYEFPEKQIYVIDRANFWWYVPEDAQVVKKKASEVLQDTTPLSFLAGIGNLPKSFIISLPEGVEPDKSGAIFLQLIPRQPQANIKRMQLKLEAKTFIILGIALVDPYGNTNDIDFRHVKVNKGIKKGVFHFVPPEGVDILDEDSSEAEKPVTPFTH